MDDEREPLPVYTPLGIIIFLPDGDIYWFTDDGRLLAGRIRRRRKGRLELEFPDDDIPGLNHVIVISPSRRKRNLVR